MDANKTKPTACAPENSSDKTSPSVSACEPEPAAPRAPQADHHGKPHSAKGKMRARRTAVALFVIALMCFSLAFHSGIGTPSSFGVGAFQLICPLGGIEALLASKTAIPHAIISLVVVLAACLVVGRAWCAWGCPAGIVQKVFGRKEVHADHAVCKRSLWETFKTDSRLWVLAGVLIATLVVGLPLFCLVCPIGLTFGTIMSIWRLIQFNDVNWGLLVFPVALVVEIVVCKAWCIKICPIAGLLSLVGRLAKPLRPRIEQTTCLEHDGKACASCFAACPAAINLHAEDAEAQLADCTRCGACKDACPTASITFPLLPKDGKKIKEDSNEYEAPHAQ
jgi:ferredoxin-type protein NapH